MFLCIVYSVYIQNLRLSEWGISSSRDLRVRNFLFVATAMHVWLLIRRVCVPLNNCSLESMCWCVGGVVSVRKWKVHRRRLGVALVTGYQPHTKSTKSPLYRKSLPKQHLPHQHFWHLEVTCINQNLPTVGSVSSLDMRVHSVKW